MCPGDCLDWTCEHCGAVLKVHHRSFGEIYQCGYMPAFDRTCAEEDEDEPA